MKSQRHQWFHQGWLIVLLIYAVILGLISLTAYLNRLPVQLAQIPGYDLFLHFGLIGMAAFLSHLAFNKRKFLLFHQILIPITPCFVALGRLGDEVLQSFFPSRQFNLLDVGADLLGIILFYILAEIVDFPKLCQTLRKSSN